MNNNNLYLLLHIIKNNSNIKRLIRENISLIEITHKIKFLLAKEFLTFKENKLSLTDKGIELYKELSDSDHKLKNKSSWIEEEKKSKIDKIDKNFVYLPNQNDIHF